MEQQSPPSLRTRISATSPPGALREHEPQSENGPGSPKHRLQPKHLRPVSPPLHSTRLSSLIYVLVVLSALLIVFYSYRIFQYKGQVGGWWNLLLGKGVHQVHVPTGLGADIADGHRRGLACGKEESVESRIYALAEVLGIPSKDLASAIAVAVREYVPPASLSSISARETGPVIDALLKGEAESINADKVRNTIEKEYPTGVVEGVVSGMGSFVGMDEP
ncbi:hypothetical protein AX16_002290 [Volvariella volvacea WC 439]|nr:hypothetical protein AX16_002290 [Volvariella volvacea WC 439]